jgi:hypothetical protein
MKYLICALAASALLPNAVASPDVAAIIRYETRVITADGMSKSTQFQESWLRAENRVWSERIVPKNAPMEAAKTPGHQGHSHNMNFALAAKLVQRDAKGEVKLELIRSKLQQIVEMSKSDYREVGFDGSWEGAAYMLDRKQLKSMTKRKVAAPDGELWLETRKNGTYTMVLWSEKLQLPKMIETGQENGSSWSRITVEPQPLPREMPWVRTAGFMRKDYIDLLD